MKFIYLGAFRPVLQAVVTCSDGRSNSDIIIETAVEQDRECGDSVDYKLPNENLLDLLPRFFYQKS